MHTPFRVRDTSKPLMSPSASHGWTFSNLHLTVPNLQITALPERPPARRTVVDCVGFLGFALFTELDPRRTQHNNAHKPQGHLYPALCPLSYNPDHLTYSQEVVRLFSVVQAKIPQESGPARNRAKHLMHSNRALNPGLVASRITPHFDHLDQPEA